MEAVQMEVSMSAAAEVREPESKKPVEVWDPPPVPPSARAAAQTRGPHPGSGMAYRNHLQDWRDPEPHVGKRTSPAGAGCDRSRQAVALVSVPANGEPVEVETTIRVNFDLSY